jgi:heat shock protein HspQ
MRREKEMMDPTTEENNIDSKFISVPPNAIIRPSGEDDPEKVVIFRNLTPKFANATAMKGQKAGIQLEFAYLDPTFTYPVEAGHSITTSFRDFEINPHTTILLEYEEAKAFHTKLGEALKKYEEKKAQFAQPAFSQVMDHPLP